MNTFGFGNNKFEVMIVELTQKETTLLKDLISHEQLCIEKYAKSSNEAHDAQLKTLFNQIGQIETQHLNTLTQISNGTIPSMSNQSGSGNTVQAVTTATYQKQDNSPNKKQDKFLCSDALATEKHVSSLYDTCIFEFRDTNIRDALNHIQKEEQTHGEKIYSYMEMNNMYS